MRKSLIFILVSITPIFHLGNGLSIKQNTNILISDGVNEGGNLEATTVTCEPTYWFLPCTTTWGGLLLNVIWFEISLCFGELLVSEGSKLFFKTYGTTEVFGARLFHILAIIPQVLLVLVNGISGSSEAAQTSAGTSMGLLVGSTFFSLTFIWGLVVLLGSLNFANGDDAEACSLIGYVLNDDETKTIARVVLISMIPFFILPLASVFHSSSGKHVVALVSLVVSVAVLAGFFIYQVVCPEEIKQRTLQCAMCQYSNNVEVTTTREGLVAIAREHSNEQADQAWSNYIKAGCFLIFGTVISLELSRPLTQTIGELSTAVNIPSFWVTYTALPLALNFRQLIVAITSAIRRREGTIPLTFSKIYIGVLMNNMAGLIILSSLVYSRNLSCDVSAEVVVVLVICLVVGLCACIIPRFPIWTSIVAVALYPSSLIILYVLIFVLGWSLS